MEDYKLKLVLSVLGGIVFSFIFILLAFALPVNETPKKNIVKPKGRLEQVSQSARDY
jgi:hypothetical protein